MASLIGSPSIGSAPVAPGAPSRGRLRIIAGNSDRAIALLPASCS